jgi:hypothetical protein
MVFRLGLQLKHVKIGVGRYAVETEVGSEWDGMQSNRSRIRRSRVGIGLRGKAHNNPMRFAGWLDEVRWMNTGTIRT